jgi:transcriptional regulator with XRE-family HTH domain
MGRGSREKPARLAEKMFQIRSALGLSQGEIVSRMRLTEKLNRDDISKYERGVREPSLIVLLRYARLAGISTDYLIDDDLDLPTKLQGKMKHQTGKKKRR